MNAIIQNQLDRVEAALNTLVSSIESYNPSVPTAIDLLAADTELQNGVKQRNSLSQYLFSTLHFSNGFALVAQHQAHHARIVRLRSAIEAQKEQKKSTLALLAESRKDLLSTPATTFPETSRSVPYTELLDYASRISRYTVPPTFRELPPPPKTANIATTTAHTGPLINGTSDAVTEAREANAIANGEVPQQGGSGQGVGVSSLEQNEVQWLNPLAQIPFAPWPTEDVIKRGNLGQIQVMLEQGVDPGMQGASAEVKKEGGEEGDKRDVQMDQGTGDALMGTGEGRTEGGERRAEPRRREEKPKVFKGLDLDEDSDDD